MDKSRLDEAVQKVGDSVQGYSDYRKMLDRKEIDAVLITTPDHWHAQMLEDACAEGKDVYVD